MKTSCLVGVIAILLVLNVVGVCGAIADHVVISEFLVDSSGTESEYEFVELYNPTNQDINISDWDIAYEASTFSSWTLVAAIPLNSTIQAYGYFLIGGNLTNPNPDLIDTSLGFSPTGGHIAIRNTSNDVIDKVGYGTANNSEGNAALAPPIDNSSERKSNTSNDKVYGNGQDTDDNSNDFYVQITPNPQNSQSCKEGVNFISVAQQNCEHITIQSAIDNANAGDTVYVSAGTYTESLTVNKNVTIRGEGSTTIIDPPQDQNGFTLTADGVTIQDLKISLETSGVDAQAIKLEGADSVTISGNTLETTGDKGIGIWVGGVGYSNSNNLKITGNTITINNESTGIYAEGGVTAQTGWAITSNEITANHGNPLELYDVTASEVSGNTLTTTALGGSNVMWFSELSNLTNIVFKDNTLSGSSGSEVAIGTDFRNDGPFFNSPTTSIITVTMTGNTFSNWGSRALRLGKVNGDGTVTGVTVSNNQFLSTGEAIRNMDASEVNAENNYWGSASPNFSAIIVGNVSYTPWLDGLEKETVDGNFTFNVTNTTSTKLDIKTNSSVEVTITKKNVTNQSSFSASGIGGFKTIEINTTNNDAVQFPVYMAVYYTNAELVSAGLTKEQLVGMFWYNPAGSSWELLNETGVNKTDVSLNGVDYSGYVWANLYHFSEYAPGSDITPPVTTNVVVTPNPTNQTTDVTLTANVTDPQNVNWSSVVMAEYFIDAIGADGNGTNMTSQDGAYDNETTEIVTKVIETSTLSKGSHTVSVHGKDESGNWGSFANATFTVNNIAPTITLNDLSFNEDTYSVTNLSGKVTDIDNTQGEINWSYYGNSANLTINIDNTTKIMNVSADANFYGVRNVTIVANDGMDSSEKNITITVTNVNDAPYYAGTFPNVQFLEDTTLNFNDLYEPDQFVDIDDPLNLAFSYASMPNITLEINNTNGAIKFSADADYFGTQSTYITARDSHGLNASTNVFNVTVTNVNDAPIINSLVSPINLLEGDYKLVDLSNYVSDVDNTDEQINWSSVNSANLVVKINNNTKIMNVSASSPIWYGTETLGLTANDGNLTDSEDVTVNVQSILSFSDLVVTIDGHDYSAANGSIVGPASPDSSVSLSVKIKNNYPSVSQWAQTLMLTGTIDSVIDDTQSISLPFNLDGSKNATRDLIFENLPAIINESTYQLTITANGTDYKGVLREVSWIIYINYTTNNNEVRILDADLTYDILKCYRETDLNVSLVNTGEESQNALNLTVSNNELGIYDSKIIPISAKEIKSSITHISLPAAPNAGKYPLNIKIKYDDGQGGHLTAEKNVNLTIGGCFNIADQSIDEDSTTGISINIYDYVNDAIKSDSEFAYNVESQTNTALINCTISGSVINCINPAANQNGYSDVNVSVINDSFVNYDIFRLTVNPVNDAPVAYNIIGVSVDEDSSVTINFNCSDVDSGSLSYAIVNAPGNGTLTGSGSSRTYTPTANYNGADSFTYRCNDGTANSNTADVNMTVNSVLDNPSIVSYYPTFDPKIGDSVSQLFNVTVNDPDPVYPIIRWYVDGTQEGTGNTFTFNKAVTGTYEVKVNMTNATTNKEHTWSVKVSDEPITTYEGTIRDVNSSNADTFSNLTIYDTNGIIDFDGEIMNLSDVVDVDRYVRIETGVIGIDSNAPGFDVFKNHAARITMYGLTTYTTTPNIYYNNAFQVSGTNECTATTDPSCTNVVYNATAGTLAFDVSHFTIFFLPAPNMPPAITSSPVTTATVDTEYRYDVEATDPESDALTYSLTTSPSGMTIDSSTGLIRWTPTIVNTTANVAVRVTDGTNTVSQSFSITVNEPDRLIISDLDIKVGDKTSKDLNDGDKISRKAKPGDKIKLDIEVKNTFSSSSDIQIDDIEVTATIKDIDDGDDLEESVDIDDLDAGDDDSVAIEFTVPTLVDEGDYDVIIEVNGEDDNGEDQEARWELTLEVKKDSHELIVEKASLSPSLVSCDRNPSLDIKVVNIGTKDEDDVTIEISNNELGLDISEGELELEEGNDEDSEFENTYTLDISDDVLPGTYPIDIKTYYDDKLSGQETVNLEIDDCADVVTPVGGDEVEVITQTIPVTTPVQIPSTKINFRDTSEYVTLLAILLVLLIGGVVFLAGAAIIILRKR